MAPTTPLSTERVLIGFSPPAYAIRLTNKSPSHLVQVLSNPLFLHWVLAWVSLYMCPLRAKSACLQPCVSQGHKPCWFLTPDILGACLSSAGPGGWDAHRLERSFIFEVPPDSSQCGSLHQGSGLTGVCLCFSCPSCNMLSFVVENMFSYFSGFHSEKIIAYVAIDLFCLWGRWVQDPPTPPFLTQNPAIFLKIED